MAATTTRPLPLLLLLLLPPLLLLLLSFHAAAAAAAEEFPRDGRVIELDESSFEAALGAIDYLFVDFYAPWCGHCKRLAPEVEGSEKLEEGDQASQISQFLEGYRAGRTTKKKVSGPSFMGFLNSLVSLNSLYILICVFALLGVMIYFTGQDDTPQAF
ncbi:hypothetical protein OsI_14574 [Oryza sativa Indica Group]|uniref:Thioredoxin domain-containing protein n=1 Tax=Oryza sativa subsp. indica TaxID=39946 RepID=A2XPL0_ORYSI|nr:hypothetical protein OsI_14574 [Oryza sativa Indica Group]